MISNILKGVRSPSLVKMKIRSRFGGSGILGEILVSFPFTHGYTVVLDWGLCFQIFSRRFVHFYVSVGSGVSSGSVISNILKGNQPYFYLLMGTKICDLGLQILNTLEKTGLFSDVYSLMTNKLFDPGLWFQTHWRHFHLSFICGCSRFFLRPLASDTGQFSH